MYTEDDLLKIEQAISKLQMGERVVSVAYGDHIVKYAEVDLNDLLNLSSWIKSDLKSSTSLNRRITFATHRDLCTTDSSRPTRCHAVLKTLWVSLKCSCTRSTLRFLRAVFPDLTRYSQLCRGLYDEIQKQISAALSDDAVQTILLDIDSVGGETSGLFDLADFIYQARSQKTIWAMCNDEAYSSAYAIASSAEKVFINRTSGIGSIGVIATHMDQSAFDEKQGVKYTTVFAGNCKNDLNPHEPITSESMQTLQSEVSRLYGMFVELVARNRSLTTEAVKTTEAGLYFGLDAIQTGFADEILTFPECIQKAASQSFIRTIAMTETVPTINPEKLLTQRKIQGRSEYHTEALELFRLCKLSKMLEKLGDFLEQYIPVNEACLPALQQWSLPM